MAYNAKNILTRLEEALEITKDKRMKPVTDRFDYKVSQEKYRKAVELLATKDNVEYAREVVNELKGNRKEIVAKVSGGSKDQSLYDKARKLDEMISKLTGLIRDYESEKKDLEYHYDLDKSDIKRGSAQYTRLYWLNPINPSFPGKGEAPYTDAGNTSDSAGN